jgi:hypothetical protein
MLSFNVTSLFEGFFFFEMLDQRPDEVLIEAVEQQEQQDDDDDNCLSHRTIALLVSTDDQNRKDHLLYHGWGDEVIVDPPGYLAAATGKCPTKYNFYLVFDINEEILPVTVL